MHFLADPAKAQGATATEQTPAPSIMVEPPENTTGIKTYGSRSDSANGRPGKGVRPCVERRDQPHRMPVPRGGERVAVPKKASLAASLLTVSLALL
jgi:hypothetical protein